MIEEFLVLLGILIKEAKLDQDYEKDIRRGQESRG